MEKYNQTEAILLKEHLSGEADGIFSALSEDRGKFNFIAKGIRKKESRLRSTLQIGHQVQLDLIEGRSLPIVHGASVTYRLQPAHADYAHLSILMYLLDLLDRLILEGALAGDDWSLIQLVLKEGGRLDNETWMHWAEEQWLQVLGYGVDYHHCVQSGKSLKPGSDGVFFQPQTGLKTGLIAARDPAQGLWLDAGCLAYLRAMQIRDPAKLMAIHLDRMRSKSIHMYFSLRLASILGHPLKSRQLAVEAL